MAVAEQRDLQAYCLDLGRRAKAAAAELTAATGAQKRDFLLRGADLLRQRADILREANELDLQAAQQFGLTDAQIDRLRLTPKVIESMAVGLEEVAALPEPIGEIIESSVRPNGLEV
jgi:glutamate-5-semialdehyde dehydrogenase